MNYEQFNIELKKITDLLSVKRFWEAIQKMKALLLEFNSDELSSSLENLGTTYINILKYSLEYKDDPERNNIYMKLARDLFALCDKMKAKYAMVTEPAGHRINLTEYDDSGTSQSIVTINEAVEFLIREQEKWEGTGKSGNVKYEQEMSGKVKEIFTVMLQSNQLKDEDVHDLDRLMKSNVPWYIKSLIVSALSISALSYFDTKKFNLLTDIYLNSEDQVWHRAAVGIFILLINYEKRLTYYPDIVNRIKSIPDFKEFQKHIEAVLIQFLKAQETEKITKKIQEEIIPEVMKMKTDLEDKLNLKELLSSETFEDKNPDWENVFKDSPDVYNKLEEFSMMQLEGSDVFMSAFAMLKKFDFFDHISNWFMPFYKENILIDESLQNIKDGFDVDAFIEGMERSTVLCNSDKYSFCLNVKHMPDMQKSMMLELFNMELKAMNEMANEEQKHNADARNKVIFTQYIQDLYRFYKLYPSRRNFADIFLFQIDISESWILKMIFDNDEVKQNIAEFFFEKHYYDRALAIFRILSGGDKSFEITEKIGFCYQKLQKYNEALKYYKKAELFDRNKLWLLKKIAFCHRKLGNYDGALSVYEEVNKLEPNNLVNTIYLGQLHIDLGDFEGALKYYYKVEYIDENNHKVHRPIAWCSFMTGNTDASVKYMDKVIKKNPTKDDYMNYGHILWSRDELKKASEMYSKAYALSGGKKDWFVKTFLNDAKYLHGKGIEDIDISIMIDSILMQSW